MSPVERLPPARPAQSGPQEPFLQRGDEPDADAEPPFATLPDVSERDLQADTLAFERVGRRGAGSWGWLKLTVLVVVIGGGAAGAWRMWGQDLLRPAGDEIPVVRAADGPFKVRPEQPGGADIPNRDKLVYERLEAGKAAPEQPESLMPRPEAPLPPPSASRPLPPESAAAASEEGSPQMVEAPGPEDAEKEQEQQAQTAVPVTPAPSTPPVAKDARPVAGPPPEQVRAVERPAPPPPPPAVKSETASVAATDIPVRAFKIQVGAVRSEAAARAEWDKLRKTHSTVLGRLALNVQRADLGPKGIFFRIQAGPFADRAAADAACAELTKQKVPCLPVRPEG